MAKDVFEQKPLPEVLVVDRYNPAILPDNKMLCSIQYRYAHLLRTVKDLEKDLEKDFPENTEIKSFV